MRAHRPLQHLRPSLPLTPRSTLTPSLSIRPNGRTIPHKPRHNSTLPPQSHFGPRLSRFQRYREEPSDIRSLRVRNPLNYIDAEYVRTTRNRYFKNKMLLNGAGAVCGLLFQAWLLFSFLDMEAFYDAMGWNEAKEGAKTGAGNTKYRLDAPVGAPQEGRQPVRIVEKPGEPGKKIDELGNELVDTGTSTIPHFPRTMHIASESADPAAQPVSGTPGQGAKTGSEEYTLLGLGVRTVSFFSIEVYVLGMYVRTSDLDRLQAAFVKLVNPIGSSLIPSEKETLRKDLMSESKSLEIWDQVLKETSVRSAVRIVPTKGTDFAHLRDGWVTGITNRTREASRVAEGKSEWDEPSFGDSMGLMKQVLSGKGKAPKASTVLLTRDERGEMQVIYSPDKRVGKGDVVVDRGSGEILGKLEDERISRQIWMGYLGGKNVSSEMARKSIVDGVMELVERPVGTVSTQVA